MNPQPLIKQICGEIKGCSSGCIGITGLLSNGMEAVCPGFAFTELVARQMIRCRLGIIGHHLQRIGSVAAPVVFVKQTIIVASKVNAYSLLIRCTHFNI